VAYSTQSWAQAQIPNTAITFISICKKKDQAGLIAIESNHLGDSGCAHQRPVHSYRLTVDQSQIRDCDRMSFIVTTRDKPSSKTSQTTVPNV